MATTLALGTDKGLFLAQRDGVEWSWTEPQFLGWRVTALGRSAAGTYLAGTASGWFGPAVQRSPDLDEWEQVTPGPRFDDGDEAELEQIWTFHQVGDSLYAGVAHAGLFRSGDDGQSWSQVTGLRAHPSTARWEPGAGGLCAHSMLHDPADPTRLWVGVSAVGVFHSTDGGDNWELANDGVRITGTPDDTYDIGYCVHALVADPDDADVIYRQDHQGLYRTGDGARTWQLANDGVPSRFGFPLVMDRSTRHLFAVPQQSDEHRVPVDGRLRVYRSTDGAATWSDASSGLPEAAGYAGVLRGAMATDHDGTVAFGTTAGAVFVSDDSGDRWQQLPVTLPRVFCTAVFDA